MELHNPNRPQIAQKPAWLSQRSVIDHPTFWVNPKGHCELQMMLPMAKGNSFMRYHARIRYADIGDFMLEFRDNPEAAVMDYFREEYPDLLPDLFAKKEANVVPLKRKRVMLR